jgi:hypothetical protein
MRLNAALSPALLPEASPEDSTRGLPSPVGTGLAGRRPNLIGETPQQAARNVSVFNHQARRLSAVLAWLVLLVPLPRLLGESTGLKYRGFTINQSQVDNLPAAAAVLKATKQQIDIVWAVGVPEEIMEFFESVPFVLVPANTVAGGTPGLYCGRVRGVEVTTGIVTTGHKPVLLHELLHAYHDQRLPQGFKNGEILGFYARAKTIGAYAPKSHMMQNEKEFFACAATTYLFGVTAQEPFARDKVRNGQPVFYAYLKNLFGPGTGNYVGSLTE